MISKELIEIEIKKEKKEKIRVKIWISENIEFYRKFLLYIFERTIISIISSFNIWIQMFDVLYFFFIIFRFFSINFFKFVVSFVSALFSNEKLYCRWNFKTYTFISIWSDDILRSKRKFYIVHLNLLNWWKFKYANIFFVMRLILLQISTEWRCDE